MKESFWKGFGLVHSAPKTQSNQDFWRERALVVAGFRLEVQAPVGIIAARTRRLSSPSRYKQSGDCTTVSHLLTSPPWTPLVVVPFLTYVCMMFS